MNTTHTIANYTFTKLTISNIMTLAHKMARIADKATPYRVRLAAALKQAHKAVLVVNTKTGARKLKTVKQARTIYAAVAKKVRATKVIKPSKVPAYIAIALTRIARLRTYIERDTAKLSTAPACLKSNLVEMIKAYNDEIIALTAKIV